MPDPEVVKSAVRRISWPDGRTWPIVDRAWNVLDILPREQSAPASPVLEAYVKEVAIWGKLNRFLTAGDTVRAALALANVAEWIRPLKGQEFEAADVGDDVVSLCQRLLARMRLRGIAKNQYSWAAKILHWLLPGCAPVYDSLVMRQRRIDDSGPTAYRRIIDWEYRLAASLKPNEIEILQGIPEMTLLGAIDNYLWPAGRG